MPSEHKKVTILINQDPFHLDVSTTSAKELRELAKKPSDYEVWQVVKEPDAEGQLPVDDIQITADVEIKSGDRFRVVPPGTFGNVSAIPKQLLEEVENLRQAGHDLKVTEADGLCYLIFDGYPLPKGYNKSATRLLLKVPLSYPNGSIDMFWVDPDLRLASGGSQSNTSEEMILGEKWLRFSWHPQNWNPGTDNLKTFLEFVNRRLQQLR
ncbi:MAG: hypothetical protein M1358_26010 [Chloroflexi bacterium]|nr:hypothetical protein [Chloroflexota bacterium]